MPEEEHAGREHVVIVSDGMWRNALGASLNAIGKKIVLNGEPYTIIGVMPPKFQFLVNKADVWAPLTLESNDDRHAHSIFVLGRLKEGVTIEQAKSELTGIAAQLAKAYPLTNASWTATVISLREQITGECAPQCWYCLDGGLAVVDRLRKHRQSSTAAEQDGGVRWEFASPLVRRAFESLASC